MTNRMIWSTLWVFAIICCAGAWNQDEIIRQSQQSDEAEMKRMFELLDTPMTLKEMLSKRRHDHDCTALHPGAWPATKQ